MKIVELTAISGKLQESGDGVVKILNDLLILAEEGKIDNIAISASGVDSSMYTAWANSNKPFVMLGGIKLLEREFFDDNIERIG